MSAEAVLAVAILLGGLGLAGLIAAREARRSGLGLGHPAVPWLGLHVLFFGLGAIALAVERGAAAPAAYAGLAAAAFGAGLQASVLVAERRGVPWSGFQRAVAAPGIVDDLRPWVAGVLAIASVALVAPILLRTGIPFLTEDITGARAEITGLVVQPLRVALPALAVAVLVRAWFVRGAGTGKVVALAVVAAIAAFELLLASRYFVAELGGAIVIGWLLAGGRVSARTAAFAVLAGVAAFAAIQLLRAFEQAQGRELAFVVERTVNRVLLVQPRTLDAIMTAIPADEPFFGGLGWLRRLDTLFGREVPNLGYWIYPRVVGGSQAVAGYAAPGLIGEAWANFGWAGLALFGLLGAAADRLAALTAMRHGLSDRVAASLLILFLARTHALGLGGLAILALLVLAWRLAVAPPAALGRDLRVVLAWRGRAM